MQTQPSQTGSIEIPSSALAVFLCVTFAITWGLVGVYIMIPEWSVATFGEISGSHPFFFLATWSPAIAAFSVVYFYAGFFGLRAFVARLMMWRGSVGWAVFILLLLPLVFALGSMIKGGSVLAPLPPEGMGPVVAGLIIGVTCGVWHLPAFFLSSTVYADWNFLPFFIGNVALAVIVTPIFNSAHGSLLWPMLFHWQLINPFWPDAQPWDTTILVGVAVFVVWWNRNRMFSRAGAVTAVIPVTQYFATKAAE